jgi:hypothetical protein
MRNMTPKTAHRGATTHFHALHQEKGGTVVIARSTGKPLSKKPLPRKRAIAQLGAIEARQRGEPGY